MEFGGDQVALESLGLVERQHHRLAGAAQLACDELILRGHAGTRVGHQDQVVGLRHRLLGLLAHLRVQALGVLDQSAGVDQHARHAADTRIAVLAIARNARHIGDDSGVAAGEHVEKRRFADIRPTDDRDDRQHGRCALTWRDPRPPRPPLAPPDWPRRQRAGR
jgi:hypothetical protein